MAEKRCADCRDGCHANYDKDIKLVTVRDPETNKMVKRAYLCNEHRNMYEMDGYIVK